jgi:hypothetical protein
MTRLRFFCEIRAREAPVDAGTRTDCNGVGNLESRPGPTPSMSSDHGEVARCPGKTRLFTVHQGWAGRLQ